MSLQPKHAAVKVAEPAIALPDASGLEQWMLDRGADYDMCPTGTTGIRTESIDLNTITTANGDATPDHTIIVNVEALREQVV